MLSEILIQLFERDLNNLSKEMNAYTDEKNIWIVRDGISNSAGNLCLHVTGNLNHFLGATLGNTGYVRNRDSEFALKNVPRAELVSGIEKVIAVIKSTLGKFSDADFAKTFPLQLAGKDVSTAYMLINLTAHLDYHLGQVNYHRRLIDISKSGD